MGATAPVMMDSVTDADVSGDRPCHGYSRRKIELIFEGVPLAVFILRRSEFPPKRYASGSRKES